MHKPYINIIILHNYAAITHAYVKLGNLSKNKAADSYTAEHIKNWSSSYKIFTFTILKINLFKESVIK